MNIILLNFIINLLKYNNIKKNIIKLLKNKYFFIGLFLF